MASVRITKIKLRHLKKKTNQKHHFYCAGFPYSASSPTWLSACLIDRLFDWQTDCPPVPLSDWIEFADTVLLLYLTESALWLTCSFHSGSLFLKQTKLSQDDGWCVCRCLPVAVWTHFHFSTLALTTFLSPPPTFQKCCGYSWWLLLACKAKQCSGLTDLMVRGQFSCWLSLFIGFVNYNKNIEIHHPSPLRVRVGHVHVVVKVRIVGLGMHYFKRLHKFLTSLHLSCVSTSLWVSFYLFELKHLPASLSLCRVDRSPTRDANYCHVLLPETHTADTDTDDVRVHSWFLDPNQLVTCLCV